MLSEAPEFRKNSLSFDVVVESEETLLAGLGLKSLCRSSEYEPGISCTFLCRNLADVLARSSMLEVHSIDLSGMSERFGFR